VGVGLGERQKLLEGFSLVLLRCRFGNTEQADDFTAVPLGVFDPLPKS